MHFFCLFLLLSAQHGRLAAQGTKFTRAYAHSICTPTRVSMLTGMNPARHRVTNGTLFCDVSTDGRHPTLTTPNWNVNGVQPGGTKSSGQTRRPIAEAFFHYSIKKPYAVADGLPSLLQKLGYTIHCRKAHFGTRDTPEANPKPEAPKTPSRPSTAKVLSRRCREKQSMKTAPFSSTTPISGERASRARPTFPGPPWYRATGNSSTITARKHSPSTTWQTTSQKPPTSLKNTPAAFAAWPKP